MESLSIDIMLHVAMAMHSVLVLGIARSKIIPISILYLSLFLLISILLCITTIRISRVQYKALNEQPPPLTISKLCNL